MFLIINDENIFREFTIFTRNPMSLTKFVTPVKSYRAWFGIHLRHALST
jgi:hypothetical protein